MTELFEDIKARVMEIIKDEVRCDIHEDIYGHDRAADTIASYIEMLELKIQRLQASDGYEDDGQPSEMQEWQDYDRDC
jgi:hypothetical protein